jgi:hypothetical protein
MSPRFVSVLIITTAIAAAPAHAQTPRPEARPPVQNLAQRQPAPAPPVELQPDAERTRSELNAILERHPPALRKILALDPTLLNNEAYLAPYPGLSAFLGVHPDIARNPRFYLGSGEELRREAGDRVMDLSANVLGGMAALIGVSMAIGLLVWIIRTLVDYRRWSRLSKVQADVHTKLVDRFTSNEDLAAYIQSPAGSKFLESSPIKLDPGPRSLSAPISRILWSMQGGVVLVCAGLGLWVVSARVQAEAAEAIQSFGVLALALGLGFIISGILSYGVARKLGLIDAPPRSAAAEQTGA